jgi:CheY-like chemotaxis protein
MQSNKRRILCVDDNEDTCEILTLYLGMSGYEVTTAHTLVEGLEKAVSGGFDLLLLDNLLPDGSGVELCQQIRGLNRKTPIVFCTADAYPKQIEKALSAGAQAYVVKPIYPEQLEHTIEQLLQ